MVSFALITEGITDQAVLENILIGIYGDDVDVNPLQPLRDATDTSRAKSDSFGGWEQVFEYCQHEDFNEVFMFNDYVIIQIDTDVGERPHFGVSLTEGGKDRPAEELVCEVRNLLISKLDPDIYDHHQGGFQFAIAVHSLECWLLPLYAQGKAHVGKKTKNCYEHLKRQTNNKPGLDCHKSYRQYECLSASFREPEALKKAKKHHRSLAIFLDSLPSP